MTDMKTCPTCDLTMDCCDCEKPPLSAQGPGSHPADAYILQIFTDWCECSPYGEQVPDDWPHLMAEFVLKHHGKLEEHMAELISEGSPDDPFEKLLESIFRTAARFVLHDLSNAVYDRNFAKLRLIGMDENTEDQAMSEAN